MCGDSITFSVKKEGWGGGGKKQLAFQKVGQASFPSLKPSGGKMMVSIGAGLPSNTSKAKFCLRMYQNPPRRGHVT